MIDARIHLNKVSCKKDVCRQACCISVELHILSTKNEW